VYSSEINDGNVHVTSKGIVNGLSVLPNDGTGWFGPDTTKGATAPGQYGSPYTETSGIQEAIEYAQSNYEIKLLSGKFNVSSAINITYNGVQISGIGGNYQGGMNNFSGFSLLNTIINVISSGINAIEIITPGVYNLGLNNMAINFTTSSTGHGIYANPGASTIGLMGNKWENIYIANVDINHYGFYIVNAVYNTYIRLGYSTGGNGMYLEENDANNDYGNSTFIECSFSSGSSSTLSPLTLNATTHQFGLSRFTFIRTQITGSGDTVPLLQMTNVGYAHFYDSDMESATSQGNSTYVAKLSSCMYITFFTVPIGYINLTNNTNNITFYSLTYTYFTGDGTQSDISVMDGQVNPALQSSISGTTFYNISTLYLFTPTISANPPVTATVYQNTNPYDIEIDLPVYATTSGTAGYVTVAKGATDTPTAIGNQYVSGDTSAASEQIIRLRVPANWYYEFTGSGVTFGTASVFAD
jgi:hypothetical protein